RTSFWIATTFPVKMALFSTCNTSSASEVISMGCLPSKLWGEANASAGEKNNNASSFFIISPVNNYFYIPIKPYHLAAICHRETICLQRAHWALACDGFVTCCGAFIDINKGVIATEFVAPIVEHVHVFCKR